MSTVLPIDLSLDRLLEFVATIRAISHDEIGRDPFEAPSPNADDPAAVLMLMMAFHGRTGTDIPAWLHDQPEAVAWRSAQPQPSPPSIMAPVLPFRGACCIPTALPGIPFGDGRRIWTPAFGCYAGTSWQDRILDACVARGHTWFEYQISGWPYRRDYPELLLDIPRIVADLARIRSRGIRTLVAFRDDQGADLTYLLPVAAATRGLVDGVFGIYEVNGVLKNADRVLDVLVQSRALWPEALLGVHFMDLVAQGQESYGLLDFGRAVREAGLNMLLFQASGGVQSPSDVAARLADFTRRLGGPRFHGYPTLSHGIVLAELTTSRTYRDWSETRGIAYSDAVRARPMATDGGVLSVFPTGYLDGVTP